MHVSPTKQFKVRQIVMRVLYGRFQKPISTPPTVSPFCSNDEEDSFQALLLGIQDAMDESAMYHLRRRAITLAAGQRDDEDDEDGEDGEDGEDDEDIAPFYCQEEEDEEETALLHAYKFQAIFSRLLLLRRNSTN
jgi:hypothetical protein